MVFPSDYWKQKKNIFKRSAKLYLFWKLYENVHADWWFYFFVRVVQHEKRFHMVLIALVISLLHIIIQMKTEKYIYGLY